MRLLALTASLGLEPLSMLPSAWVPRFVHAPLRKNRTKILNPASFGASSSQATKVKFGMDTTEGLSATLHSCQRPRDRHPTAGQRASRPTRR